MSQVPSVGRIVHYQSYGTPGGEFKPLPRAAIITAVADVEKNIVDICVLNPTGFFFNQAVAHSDTAKPGCWSWPPRT